jgi:hypothetical protein
MRQLVGHRAKRRWGKAEMTTAGSGTAKERALRVGLECLKMMARERNSTREDSSWIGLNQAFLKWKK